MSHLSLLLFLLIIVIFLCEKNESISQPNNNHNNNKYQQPPRQLSLVTWNILAQQFAIPYKYPWTITKPTTSNNHVDEMHQKDGNDVLEWSYRKKLILQQIQTTLEYPNILCFQEVDLFYWKDDDFKNDLCSIGYEESVVQCRKGENKNKQHPIVNVILVKKDCGLEIVRTESRSRALIAVLNYYDCALSKETKIESLPTKNTTIYLANVHLDAQSTSTKTRYLQLSSLFKRIIKQCHMDQVSPSGACIIVAGDFNFEPQNELHEWIRTGDSIPFRIPLTTATASSSLEKKSKRGNNRKQKKKEKKGRTKVEVVYTKKVVVNDGIVSSSKNDEKNDRNTFPPLKDAYQCCQIPGETPLRFTYGSGVILDYIFASSPPPLSSPSSNENDESLHKMDGNSGFQILRTIPQIPYFHHETHKNNIGDSDDDYEDGKPGDAASSSRSFIPIPSDSHPSDHIPIGVVFSLS